MGRIVQINIKLKKKDYNEAKRLMSGGLLNVRVAKRVQVLLQFHRGLGSPDIAAAVGLTPVTARRVGVRYIEKGLKHAIYESKRPGQKPRLNQKQFSRIAAIACSNAPPGRESWTIDLLREEAVKRGIVESLGHETLRVYLHRHGIKPWQKKNVVRRVT